MALCLQLNPTSPDFLKVAALLLVVVLAALTKLILAVVWPAYIAAGTSRVVCTNSWKRTWKVRFRYKGDIQRYIGGLYGDNGNDNGNYLRGFCGAFRLDVWDTYAHGFCDG